MDIHLVPLPPDNYAYLLRDDDTGAVGVVDPGIAAPVLGALDQLGWQPTHVFLTHHHADHIGGALEVATRSGAEIVASVVDRERIAGVHRPVGDGDVVVFGRTAATVLFIPGHTTGHVAYLFADDHVVFTGDTLFALGCGRLLGGTAAQLWASLQRLRALPDDTRVYCGHEYTLANARFARSIDPDNPDLAAFQAEAIRQRAAGIPTIPTTVGREWRSNPFLRADDDALQKALGQSGAPAVEVFAALRARKDTFRG